MNIVLIIDHDHRKAALNLRVHYAVPDPVKLGKITRLADLPDAVVSNINNYLFEE